jgi:hypothetical protein
MRVKSGVAIKVSTQMFAASKGLPTLGARKGGRDWLGLVR